MTTQFYRITESEGKPVGLYGPRRQGVYRVDGQVAEPPADSIQVEIVIVPSPTITATQKLQPTQTLDQPNNLFTYGWNVVDKTAEELRAALPELNNAQMKTGLHRAGVLDQVSNFVNSISNPDLRILAQNRFKSQPTFRRDGPLVEAIRQVLGWSQEATDQFYRDSALL